MSRHILTGLLAGWPGAAGLFLRQHLYRSLFAECGKHVVFGRNIVVENPERIRIGERVFLSDGCRLDGGAADSNGVHIGGNVFIGTGTSIGGGEGTVEIGEGSSVGSYCSLGSGHSVRIGKHVLFAAYCTTAGHGKESGEDPARETLVGNGCWLGLRAALCKGVHVGRDTIVGAHAVVETDIPERVVAVGHPARILRSR